MERCAWQWNLGGGVKRGSLLAKSPARLGSLVQSLPDASKKASSTKRTLAFTVNSGGAHSRLDGEVRDRRGGSKRTTRIDPHDRTPNGSARAHGASQNSRPGDAAAGYSNGGASNDGAGLSRPPSAVHRSDSRAEPPPRPPSAAPQPATASGGAANRTLERQPSALLSVLSSGSKFRAALGGESGKK